MKHLVNKYFVLGIAFFALCWSLGQLIEFFPTVETFEKSFYRGLALNLNHIDSSNEIETVTKSNDGQYLYEKWIPQDSTDILYLQVNSIEDQELPTRMDYAIALDALKDVQCPSVNILAPLSWLGSPPPIETEAMTHALRQNKAWVGVTVSPSARKRDMPESLKLGALSADQVEGDISGVMGVEQIVEAPQLYESIMIPLVPLRVNSEDNSWQSSKGGISIPLFYRWRNTILPTMPLVAVLRARGLSTSDIHVNFGGKLCLGESTELPIDIHGCIDLPQTKTSLNCDKMDMSDLFPFQKKSFYSIKKSKKVSRYSLIYMGEEKNLSSEITEGDSLVLRATQYLMSLPVRHVSASVSRLGVWEQVGGVFVLVGGLLCFVRFYVGGCFLAFLTLFISGLLLSLVYSILYQAYLPLGYFIAIVFIGEFLLIFFHHRLRSFLNAPIPYQSH